MIFSGTGTVTNGGLDFSQTSGEGEQFTMRKMSEQQESKYRIPCNFKISKKPEPFVPNMMRPKSALTRKTVGEIK